MGSSVKRKPADRLRLNRPMKDVAGDGTRTGLATGTGGVALIPSAQVGFDNK